MTAEVGESSHRFEGSITMNTRRRSQARCAVDRPGDGVLEDAADTAHSQEKDWGECMAHGVRVSACIGASWCDGAGRSNWAKSVIVEEDFPRTVECMSTIHRMRATGAKPVLRGALTRQTGVCG